MPVAVAVPCPCYPAPLGPPSLGLWGPGGQRILPSGLRGVQCSWRLGQQRTSLWEKVCVCAYFTDSNQDRVNRDKETLL